MNLLLCDVAKALSFAVNIYTIVLLIYAVMSWIPDLRGGKFAYYLGRLVEPVLWPIRRIIPPLGGLDIAFLLLLLVLQLLVRPELTRLADSACYSLF